MRNRVFRLTVATALLGLVALVVWSLWSAPRHPAAMLRVVDGAGNPIRGAVIRPEGLRTKPGPYVSGWYGWTARESGVPNDPVTTDADGSALVPYPKFVFERIETGTLCLSVAHPDYVPERPEVMVATTPPAGAPWRIWADYVLGRLRHRVLVARPDPIVLTKGAILKLSVKTGPTAAADSSLYAQVSGLETDAADFWSRPAPGVLITRRLRSGPEMIRAVQFEANGMAWFSPVIKLTASAGRTNEIEVDMTPGAAVHGRLDDTVPRPVRNGRVIAQVWPAGEQAQNSPPQWHAWSPIRPEGTFDIGSLPQGTLELVALCDGFVSTNGPGQFPSMHYPQKLSLGSNDLAVTIGMEPTASLEVMVKDNQGKPLKDARVAAWPNVRYGEWSATVIGQDCYNTGDLMCEPAKRVALKEWWTRRPALFQATSDVSGLALIRDLPVETREFAVEHPRFILPATDTGYGQKRREASVILEAGRTNRVTVSLEPAGQAPIRHY